MTAIPGDALEAGLWIARELEKRGVSYALGGALAYGQYGIPRATNDVDVNVFVDLGRLEPVLDALRALGSVLDGDAGRAQAAREGLLVARLGPFRVDVFVPSIDFSWEAERTRVRFELDGEPVWFLSAEALCVFKLMFFRGKDLVDLERLLAVSGPQVNTAYVRARIVEIMGEDDLRVAAWDRLCAEHAPG